jgi:hypothetical protein
MPSLPRSSSFVFATSALLAFAAAQEPKASAKSPAPLVFRIECTVPGSPVPRIAEPSTETAARVRRWEGRELAWHIGTGKVGTKKALTTELKRIAQDPKFRYEPALEPGRECPVPLRIQPGDDVRWGDVTEAFDAAFDAGFVEVALEGVSTTYFVPKTVDHPILDEGVLIVPKMVFHEPDDRPHPRRPIFDVHQDGRITHDGDTLFTWVAGKTDDLEPLRARLRALREDLVAKGHLVRRFDDLQKLDVTFLVRADRWTEWRDVRRLMVEVLDEKIGFWKCEWAAAEFDFEAKMRERARGSDKER